MNGTPIQNATLVALRSAAEAFEEAEREGSYGQLCKSGRALYDALGACVVAGALDVGDTVATPNGPMTVWRRDGILTTFTKDGGPALSDWHQEPVLPNEVGVYYERFTSRQGHRAGHGFVHPESRRIVQTG